LGSPIGQTDPPFAASDLDEFKIKREQVFKFKQKPRASRAGDKVSIEFASEGFCDATVATEDRQGNILRHLASGALGPRAPGPFKKNAKKQAIIWDGKDDRGVYVDDKDNIVVRVGLGLKPRYEGPLFWEPRKRISQAAPLLCATKEGMYVRGLPLASGGITWRLSEPSLVEVRRLNHRVVTIQAQPLDSATAFMTACCIIQSFGRNSCLSAALPG
jgi:hypothetical protein